MAVQIKHVNGMIFLIKDGGNTPIDLIKDGSVALPVVNNALGMTEEEAIHVLGKQHPVIMECKQYNKEAKKKEIEELEFKLKKLKENLL